MVYEVGDMLKCIADAAVCSQVYPGETVEVVHVDDDGTPIVDVRPVPENGYGRAMRLPAELRDLFEPA